MKNIMKLIENRIEYLEICRDTYKDKNDEQSNILFAYYQGGIEELDGILSAVLSAMKRQNGQDYIQY